MRASMGSEDSFSDYRDLIYTRSFNPKQTEKGAQRGCAQAQSSICPGERVLAEMLLESRTPPRRLPPEMMTLLGSLSDALSRGGRERRRESNQNGAASPLAASSPHARSKSMMSS